ncbi:MAG: NAD(P)-binding protein [Gammaproteobacteria bacterium]|nr:NAD(P)-binding protein [Gammaproteobacteria bacterium]
MNKHTLEADYVIIGAGAVSMAIADTLLTESKHSVIMIDRRHKPGGHWNDAYPFVRLHAPSAMYGVNSKSLGSDNIDDAGLNKGFLELATGSEICTYFDEVMRHDFLPSGRLRYLPLHDYGANGEATSLISGDKIAIKAKKKVFEVAIGGQVPSCTPPAFNASEAVTLIPPNDLVKLSQTPERYVVIGGGKTAVDTLIWLLENGASPDLITWIRPRDSWYMNRIAVQPSDAFFEQTFGGLVANMEAAAAANCVDDIFLRLEQKGYMLRTDSTLMPSMYRCAIISEAELEQLKRVTNVVRLGHVQSVEPGKVVLDKGELSVPSNTVFVHCSANGIPHKQAQPVFQGNKIVPQLVQVCQPCISAAFTAKVELMLSSDAEKNALCQAVPIPDKPIDWLVQELATGRNIAARRHHDWVNEWLDHSRLSLSSMAKRAANSGEETKLKLLERFRLGIKPAAENMARLVTAAS